MTFNDYCKYLKDKYDIYVCDDAGFISYIEKVYPNYRNMIESCNFWEAAYTKYRR